MNTEIRVNFGGDSTEFVAAAQRCVEAENGVTTAANKATSAIAAGEKATTSAGISTKELGKQSAVATETMSKLSNIVSMISPELGDMVRGLMGVAESGKVVATTAEAMEMSLGPVAVAAGAVMLAIGAVTYAMHQDQLATEKTAAAFDKLKVSMEKANGAVRYADSLLESMQGQERDAVAAAGDLTAAHSKMAAEAAAAAYAAEHTAKQNVDNANAAIAAAGGVAHATREQQTALANAVAEQQHAIETGEALIKQAKETADAENDRAIADKHAAANAAAMVVATKAQTVAVEAQVPAWHAMRQVQDAAAASAAAHALAQKKMDADEEAAAQKKIEDANAVAAAIKADYADMANSIISATHSILGAVVAADEKEIASGKTKLAWDRKHNAERVKDDKETMHHLRVAHYEAAMADYVIQQGSAVASLALGFVKAQAANLPNLVPPATAIGIATEAALIAATAAQGAAIAAAPVPKMHTGGEVQRTLLEGEGVVSRSGMQQPGMRQAVEGANTGTSTAGGGVYEIQILGRTIQAAQKLVLKAGGAKSAPSPQWR